MDEYVIPNNTVHDYIQNEWNQYVGRMEEYYDGEREEEFARLMEINFGQYADEYRQFKREIQSEVNYLVKEFECKKAATSYARATVSKTGVLDCSKLHTYKYSEDIFKKVTTLHEGKNHGLVFLLDWSGSMAPVLQDTMKQLLSLVSSVRRSTFLSRFILLLMSGVTPQTMDMNPTTKRNFRKIHFIFRTSSIC